MILVNVALNNSVSHAVCICLTSFQEVSKGCYECGKKLACVENVFQMTMVQLVVLFSVEMRILLTLIILITHSGSSREKESH